MPRVRDWQFSNHEPFERFYTGYGRLEDGTGSHRSKAVLVYTSSLSVFGGRVLVRRDDQCVSGQGLPPVLVLGDHFGYPSGVAHGVTVYFLNVLPALVQAGVSVSACFLREPHPAAAALSGSGVEPVFLSASPMNPLVVFRVAALARENGCGIIHASGIKATLVARVAALMIGAKVIIHVHDQLYPSPWVSALHKLFSHSSDIGLCVSNAVRQVVAKGYHVRPDRLRVAYNGIRLERIRSVPAGTRLQCRESLQLTENSRVIAMIGRMHAIKGHRGMLQMMPNIIAACPDAVLLLVGDGPERADYEVMADKLGLGGHVRFLGQRNDIPELLTAADIVVVPSQSEGLSLAAIEALAAGRPVVAYAVGGLPEVVNDGSDGTLVKSGDQDAFARAVISLLNDPQRLSRYGQQAACAAERFSLERHIEVLLGCYRELSGSGSSPPLPCL